MLTSNERQDIEIYGIESQPGLAGGSKERKARIKDTEEYLAKFTPEQLKKMNDEYTNRGRYNV